MHSSPFLRCYIISASDPHMTASSALTLACTHASIRPLFYTQHGVFSYTSSTVSMNGRDIRAHQIWCGGICPQFLPGRKEDDSIWTELALKTMKWEGMLAQAEASCEGTRGALLSMFPETWVLGGIKNSDSE